MEILLTVAMKDIIVDSLIIIAGLGFLIFLGYQNLKDGKFIRKKKDRSDERDK